VDVRDDEELEVALQHRVRERRDEPARHVVDIDRGAAARASFVFVEQLRGVSTARRAEEEESGRTSLISLTDL
jgi:hypothetical protein